MSNSLVHKHSSTAAAATNCSDGSTKNSGRTKNLKITHQTTQQRRTLMGLRRQQRVEEFQDEGDSSSCAESGMHDDPLQPKRRQNAADSLHASPNLRLAKFYQRLQNDYFYWKTFD